MKTVRETAKELNISRQAVYSKLTDKFKKEFTTIKQINNRDTLVITKAGLERLRQDIVKPDSQVDSKVDKVIDSDLTALLSKNVEVLQEQLKIKDTQISELNERLREQQELNKNNQVLLHREQENNKLLSIESMEQKESRSILDKIKGIFKSNE